MNAKLFLASIIFCIIFLDQLTKALAVKFLPTACNQGIAFGFLPGNWSLAPSFLVIVFLGWLLIKRGLSRLASLALALIIGGGISNLMSRLENGCVLDFVSLAIWPAFNLADAAITIGTGILVLSVIGGFTRRDVKGS